MSFLLPLVERKLTLIASGYTETYWPLVPTSLQTHHHDHIKHPVVSSVPLWTYFTAGARALNVTIPNPAARTAADCNRPAATRVPTGMASMALKSGEFDRQDLRCSDIQDKETDPID